MDIKAIRQYHHEREARRWAERESERQRCLQQVRELVAQYAPSYPGIQGVYLFGSLMQPGRFKPDSDIDIALECDTLETESAFWRILERKLQRNVDMRPLTGVIKEAVANGGERLYERQDPHSIE